MRKLVFVVAVSFLVFAFMGCQDGRDGRDGEDGAAYIQFDWDWYVDSYSDNNPSIPEPMSDNVNYETQPGTYSFIYLCSDLISDWYWEGYYIIEINEGEPGEEGEPASFFSDGADGDDGDDGEDLYYEMFLDGLDGVDFTVSKPIIGEKELLTELNSPDKNFQRQDYQAVGDVVVRTFLKSGKKMIVEKQLYLKRANIQE